MENTKEFITYNVCLDREHIHHSEGSHKTYSEAKAAIAARVGYYSGLSDMREDNRKYWLEKYSNAFIVEQVTKYIVIE